MKFVQTQDKLARRLQSTLQCTRLFWILPFSLQSTRVAEWLSSETTFVKGWAAKGCCRSPLFFSKTMLDFKT